MPEAKLSKQLFTAHAAAIGGRNGHTETTDGLVSFDLSVPNSMGGPGKPNAVTPEHLFAAGYAACFGGACDLVAKKMKIKTEEIKIFSDVTIGDDGSGGLALEVRLRGQFKGVDGATTEKIMQEAHNVCPYSKAIKASVKVTLEAEGARKAA